MALELTFLVFRADLDGPRSYCTSCMSAASSCVDLSEHLFCIVRDLGVESSAKTDSRSHVRIEIDVDQTTFVCAAD